MAVREGIFAIHIAEESKISMKIENISPVSMVAVNETSVTGWKHKKDTPIDFQQLLQNVIEKDEEKPSNKYNIRIVTSRNDSYYKGALGQDEKNDIYNRALSKAEGTDTYNQTKQAEKTENKDNVSGCTDVKGNYNPETVYDEYFEDASEKYGVPVDLLKAVAKVESDFKPTVVSSSGAVGIMQLMPATARSMGVEDSYNPQQNIYGGAKLLSILLEQFDGDVDCALAGYNAGAGAVERAGGVPSYAQDYVDKVLGYYLG